MIRSISILLILFVLSVDVLSAADDVTTLTAPDNSTVVIYRDLYGVPHIRASTEIGAFFGHGYAVAQDRLFQMEIFRRTALGRLSEAGLATPATDQQLRATTYTEAERAEQFADLAPDIQSMITAYVSGVNAYLAVIAQDPFTLRPAQFFAPQLNFSPDDPKAWTVSDVVAVCQFFMRQFGQYGGEELIRLGELLTFGQEWFDENRPINDPDAPTTIPGAASLARAVAPPGPATSAGQRVVRKLSDTHQLVRPEFVNELWAHRAAAEAELAAIHVPPKLGSFAVITSPQKSSTGNVMLLGAPQLTPPALNQTNITHEVELDAATLHVAGMAIAGVPGVIIGHTQHHAWTLTSGNSDNTDTFIEILNEDRTAYLHNGTFHPFEVIPEPDLGFSRLRTIHGPVIALDPVTGNAFSWQFTFWGREMEMVDAFYRIWKVEDLNGFEAALSNVPMNFNVFYAGKDQRIKFFHVGALLRSTQTLSGPDPRLPKLGDGSEDWPSDPFLSFDELPQADESVQDYFVNWNNKPEPAWNNGDNIAWSIIFRLERTTRVQRIEDFIGPLSEVSFADLETVPLTINDHGTYQQVVEFTPDFIRDVNIIPPGQSGFISAFTGPSPHIADQWALHEAWTFKNMVFNEPIRLWPPNGRTVTFEVGDFVDTGDPATAYTETVWSDEPGRASSPITVVRCTSVRVNAARDAHGNGRVYTIHIAAPDPVGQAGTAALFQAFVPKSASPLDAFAPDDGPAVTEDPDCSPEADMAARPAAATGPRLDQNRPNPFNPSTQIQYELPKSGRVILSVYNLLGQEVARLVDQDMPAGTHSIEFDASGLSSGVYFYRLQAPGASLTRKMILQK